MLIRHAIAAAQPDGSELCLRCDFPSAPPSSLFFFSCRGERSGTQGHLELTHQRNDLVAFEQAVRTKGRRQLDCELDLGYGASWDLESRVWPSAAENRAELGEGRQLVPGDI